VNKDKKLVDAIAREDFYAFAVLFFPIMNPGAKFMANWHHKALAHRLSQCKTAYEFSRLIINLPTQHGKSEIITLFIAWSLGRDPKLNILWVCFSEALVARFGTLLLRIMQSHRYRQIYSGCILDKQTTTEITTTAGGRRYGTTMQGQITGQPADMLIIDDPHKIDSYLSRDELLKASQTYDETLASRLSQPSEAVVICVMQRIAPDDLTGHLLSRTAEPWDQLKLPLVAEEEADIPIGPDEIHHRRKGDILHPEWRNENDVKGLQQNPRAFASQQQQNPMPDGGVILKPSYLGTYEEPLYRHHFETVFIGVDGAWSVEEHASYSAMVALGVKKNRFYVFDAWRGRVEIPDLIKQTEAFISALGPTHVIIEYAASGMGLYQTLRPKYDNSGIYKYSPKGSKADRLYNVLSLFVTNRVLFPKPNCQSKAMAALCHELLTAPNGKTDDLMDALTAALIAIFGYGVHNRPQIDYTYKSVSLSFWTPPTNI